MAHALYFLVKNQQVYKNLQSILESTLPDGGRSFTYEHIKNIPLLEGIINETLRLKPVIPSGQPRVTPAQGLQIDEVYIPGDVNIIIPQFVIQRDERYFERAKEWIPERWVADGDKAHMVKDKNAFFPFQLGKCFLAASDAKLF